MGIEVDLSKNELSELPVKDCLSFVGESLKPSISSVTISCPEENSVYERTQIAECSVGSCLTSVGSPGGVPILASKPSFKKRLHPLLQDGDLQHRGGMRQEVHWMSSI